MYKIIYPVVALLMLTSCGNPLKWFTPKSDAVAPASVLAKGKDAQIAYWKDLAEHAQAESKGLSAGQKFTFYILGLIAIAVGIYMSTIPMRKLGISSIGLGLVCWVAPSLIVALEVVSATIVTVIQWGIYLSAGAGLIYIIWMLVSKLKQSVRVGQNAKRLLKKKLTKAVYTKELPAIHEGVKPCKIIEKLKRSI